MRARFALALAVMVAPPLAAQGAPAAARPTRTIEERTGSMRKLDGFFPLYWDSTAGQLFMEIPRLNTEVLHTAGIGAGLGSNDIGIDRGGFLGSRIVKFERVGPRVMMVQPNYRFRSTSSNAAEVKSVRDAFARSVLWGFNVAAESEGGRRVLVDVTDFLVRDPSNLGGSMQGYRLEPSRSSVYMPMTMNFPKNTEMEVELTFVPAGAGGGGGGRGGGGGAFESVGAVAATGEAASIRVHQSFVELPDTSGYEHRAYDPRSGFGGFSFEDYSAPLGQPMTFRSIRRHRLAKVNPSAAVSEAVKPIVYYLDPGTPEPIRTALLEGGRWWNQAFEAIGYRNAFRVEMLPEGASSMDIRYNVINWVHRSTRGWSSGASVTDPRTGEILKAVVTLGSLRVRQDWMILEGLLQPYGRNNDVNPEIRRWALQRIRQLSAHEIGHTLGFGHNYYDSDAGFISVMDYPHPLVTLKPDGSLDVSRMYGDGIAEWDKVGIAYGYQDFPPGTNEAAALKKILDDAWAKDIRYMSNQDIDVSPRADQWSNGTDAAAELNRMMEVRRVSLARFGENAIKTGDPMARLEDVLVPLYLHHRYQVEAAASVLGGQHYIYAFRGDGRTPTRPASAAEQRAALTALMGTLAPSALALPQSLVALIPPRPPGWGRNRELFPRFTGGAFDAITPAVVAAGHTLNMMLTDDRAARLVEQKALDPSLPGLDDVLDAIQAATFGATTRTPYEAEVKRAVQRVVVDELMSLAAGAPMPQVRALATLYLQRIAAEQSRAASAAGSTVEVAQAGLIASDVKRFLERPATAADIRQTPQAPPGAPIGDPGMDWLNRVYPPCNWHGWWD
ncbi:MAG TPA: zinc-dependent metalloprotease [Gemmatimonadaceae bacterium]|nr:zinc-dependent metalloprotease [Gemmatimonadaceae bacterium]